MGCENTFFPKRLRIWRQWINARPKRKAAAAFENSLQNMIDNKLLVVTEEKKKALYKHGWNWEQFCDYMNDLDDDYKVVKEEEEQIQIPVAHPFNEHVPNQLENDEANQAFIAEPPPSRRPLTPQEVILGPDSPVQELSAALAAIDPRHLRERPRVDYKRLHKLGWK